MKKKTLKMKDKYKIFCAYNKKLYKIRQNVDKFPHTNILIQDLS